MDVLSPRIQNHITYKIRGKWQYLSVLVLKILRTWLFSQEVHGIAVRVAHDTSDSTILYLLLLYIYAEFIHVCCIDTPSFQSWNLRDPPPPKRSVRSYFSSKTSLKYEQSTSCVEGFIKLQQREAEKLTLHSVIL